MALINLLAATALFATTSAFNMTCNNDNTITINIPYEKKASILKFTYGTCNEGNQDFSTAQDPNTFDFRITLDVERCGMDGVLRTLDYNQTAFIVVGRKQGDFDLIFSDYTIEAYCSYADRYVVRFSYGELEMEHAVWNETAGTVNLTFAIDSYNANFSKKAVASKIGGDMIHLGLSVTSAGFSHDRIKYAPTKCTVYEVGHRETFFTLFDTASTCKNDVIDLSVAFVNDIWQISHILFLLDSKRSSTYELECQVIACDAGRADACNAVVNACA
jgi:hypothetical protein